MSDWGQGSKNNNIGWGQGAVNNSINWGLSHSESWAGDTNIIGGTTYDTDYQAILDYATTQGYTLPSDSQKLLQNQLLVDLKNAGIWSKLDTFANFATDGSSNFALIDWKRLSLLTAVNSPTFITNDGFMGNGTSSYIDTNFNPATQGVNYTLNNASRYLYLKTGVVGSRLDGNLISTNFMRFGSFSTHNINSASGTSLVPSFSLAGDSSMKAMNRTSSTNVEMFNGTTQGSSIALSSVLPNSKQFILRQDNLYSASKVYMYAMGASLVSENTAFVNAYNTYINSL